MAGALVVGVFSFGTAASAAPIDVDQECTASNVVSTGNPTIGGPISTQIAGAVFTLPLPTEVTATAEVIPGGTIAYQADIDLDLQTLAQEIFTNQVRPGIVTQGGEAIAATASFELGVQNLNVDFAAPADTTLTGTPSASTLPGGSPAATASTVGTSARVSIAGPVKAGVYQAGNIPPNPLPTLSPFTIRLLFSAAATGATEGDTIVLNPGPASFGLIFDVGILAGGAIAGATATMSCAPVDATLELASTTILAPIAPDAPTAVGGSPGNEQVVVNWTPPASDGGSPITGYEVTADPDGATCTTTGATSCVVTGLTNDTAYTFTVTATNAVGTSPPSAASEEITPAAPTETQYFELPPHRILNTFDGGEPFGPTERRDIDVTGGDTTVPENAQSVALNVTGVHPTEDTHLTLWPAGQTQPNASNINLPPGSTRPNLVIVKVGRDDEVSLYNNSGDINVIVDVVGYFADEDGGVYTGIDPERVLSTYDGTGTDEAPFGPGESRDLVVAGTGTPVPEEATAVVLNLTGVFPSAGTHLTVWPTGTLIPEASSLNVEPNQTNANLVIAKVGNDHSVSIYNNSGEMNVLADVVGYFVPSIEPGGGSGFGAPTADVPGVYTAITPNRILDSSTGTGGFDTPWEAGQTRDLVVTGGITNVPDNATAIVVNLTAVQPTVGTHLTMFPAGIDLPDVSNLNLPTGDTRANLAIVKIGIDDEVSIYNNTGDVDVIADVVGYFVDADDK